MSKHHLWQDLVKSVKEAKQEAKTYVDAWEPEAQIRQKERRLLVLQHLIGELPESSRPDIPAAEEDRNRLIRALFNIRPPWPADEDFLALQDEFLQAWTAEKGITDVNDLEPVEPGIYLWQGDITTLRCDAIVNAANSGMLGCFHPNHACIDNFIHTFAGIELRLACAAIMDEQGHEEPTGQAKLTPGFNLPAKYILHTVGPIVQGELTGHDEELLVSCYVSCLEAAREKGLKNVAFCCISTGVFGYPQEPAARTAIETVRRYRSEHADAPEVIFNVFKDSDLLIYQKLLGQD